MLVLSLLGSTAWADNRDRRKLSKGGDRVAASLFAKGMKHFKGGRYDQALKRFLESDALVTHPNKLYNIAECYRRMGKLRKSFAYYFRYTKTLPPDKREAFAAKLLKLRTAKPCALSVVSTPGGASVTVDGKSVGTTPTNLKFPG